MKNLEKRKKIEELLLSLERLTREEIPEEEESPYAFIFNYKKQFEIDHSKIDITNMDYLITLGSILTESVNFKSIVDLESGEIALFTDKKYKDTILKILRLILGDSVYPSEKVDEKKVAK